MDEADIVGNWGSANPGFTMRTGLADRMTLHTFELVCFLWHALVLFGFPR